MTPLFKDPVVLICAGTILIGIFGFVWAIAKLRSLGRTNASKEGADFDEPLPAVSELRGLDFGTPPIPTQRPSPAVSSTPTSMSSAPPAVSKEVSERLDNMTQRLAEMQNVLTKQGTDPAAPGAMGQGFSPETIDKLLRIIGNVVQQVDILQKNLNTGGDVPPAAKETPSAPLGKL